MKAVHTPNLADLCFDARDDDGRLVPGAMPEEERQGQFDVVVEPSGQKRFWFVCPGPCRSLSAVALRPVVDGSAQSWEFDGNMQAPNLSPSLCHVDCWHGWLRAGEFVSC